MGLCGFRIDICTDTVWINTVCTDTACIDTGNFNTLYHDWFIAVGTRIGAGSGPELTHFCGFNVDLIKSQLIFPNVNPTYGST